MLWRDSWSITGQTYKKLTSICFFTITNCPLSFVAAYLLVFYEKSFQVSQSQQRLITFWLASKRNVCVQSLQSNIPNHIYCSYICTVFMFKFINISWFTCSIQRYLFNSRNKTFIQGVSTLWQSVTALPSFLFLSAQISSHSEHFTRVYRLRNFLRSKWNKITGLLHESDNFKGNYLAFSVAFLPKTRAQQHITFSARRSLHAKPYPGSLVKSWWRKSLHDPYTTCVMRRLVKLHLAASGQNRQIIADVRKAKTRKTKTLFS